MKGQHTHTQHSARHSATFRSVAQTKCRNAKPNETRKLAVMHVLSLSLSLGLSRVQHATVLHAYVANTLMDRGGSRQWFSLRRCRWADFQLDWQHCCCCCGSAPAPAPSSALPIHTTLGLPELSANWAMLKAVAALCQLQQKKQHVAAASRSNRLVSRLHLVSAARVWLTALSVCAPVCVCAGMR